MKKSTIIIASVVYFFGIIYLTLPSPSLPDLDNSVRSTEEGDTIQHPDQKAFYTNVERKDVIKEMQSKFVVKIGNFVIPSMRLNYRPEETKEFVREQTPSSYLEEIVYPFRESLFVNGFEPANSPIYRNWAAKDVPKVIHLQVNYFGKVTLRPVYSPIWARVLVWTLIFPSIYFVFLSLKRSIRNGH